MTWHDYATTDNLDLAVDGMEKVLHKYLSDPAIRVSDCGLTDEEKHAIFGLVVLRDMELPKPCTCDKPVPGPEGAR